MAEPQKWVPPYIAFSTLTGLLDRMRDDDGAPPLIDRSYLKGLSGGYQSQVIASMKALGLINADGSVTPVLIDLVAAKDRPEREPLIAALLEKFFPEPVRAWRNQGDSGSVGSRLPGVGHRRRHPAKGDRVLPRRGEVLEREGQHELPRSRRGPERGSQVGPQDEGRGRRGHRRRRGRTAFGTASRRVVAAVHRPGDPPLAQTNAGTGRTVAGRSAPQVDRRAHEHPRRHLHGGRRGVMKRRPVQGV